MGITSGTSGRLGKGKAAAAGLLLAAVLVPAGAGTSVAAPGFGPQAHRYEDSNWGGYAAQGTFTNISGSWVEPQATCNSSNDLFAPWVGLDGFGSSTVEQTGVQTDCSSGKPVLSAWYEMYPAAPVYFNDAVSEGDTISASVVSNGGGKYTLTISDKTKGWTENLSKSLSAQNASAEAVIESPTNSYPSFSKLTFSGVTVDGQPFENANPTDLESGGYGPGTLSGGSFSMTPGFGGAQHAQPSEQATHGAIRY